MGEKVKKLLKRTIKFACCVCSVLAGVVLWRKISAKEHKEKM